MLQGEESVKELLLMRNIIANVETVKHCRSTTNYHFFVDHKTPQKQAQFCSFTLHGWILSFFVDHKKSKTSPVFV